MKTVDEINFLMDNVSQRSFPHTSSYSLALPIHYSLAQHSSFEKKQLGQQEGTQVSSDDGWSRGRSSRGGGHHQQHHQEAQREKHTGFSHFDCFSGTVPMYSAL